MSTVQSSTTVTDPLAATSAAAKSTATTTNSAADMQDRFLNLLVAQLKNQDPLNPMDNAQMTSEMAQMSTVSGIENLNTTLNSLLDSYGTSQSMQASSLIGKNVLVAGSQLDLSSGKAYAGINLASAADQITVTISDSAGNVVQTEHLGAHDAGVFDIAWDGTTSAGTTAADGTYKFAVSATQGGSSVTADALEIGTVSALVKSNGKFLLDLGTLGTVDFKDVQQVL